MRISDWSSDVCSSDLLAVVGRLQPLQDDGGVEAARIGEHDFLDLGHGEWVPLPENPRGRRGLTAPGARGEARGRDGGRLPSPAPAAASISVRKRVVGGTRGVVGLGTVGSRTIKKKN